MTFVYLYPHLNYFTPVNSKKIRLDVNNNNPFNIKMNVSKNETHALIRLTKGAFCESLNLLLTDKGVMAPRNIPAKALTLLSLADQPEFSLNANFSSAKGFIEAEIFRGGWEEILLAEVEFSFTSAPYNISCNQEKVEFTIGVEGESQIRVLPREDGGFDVTYTVLKAPAEKIVQNHLFEENSDATQIVKRLYGRIKGRVKGDGFEERQAQYQNENTKNLNRTMLESFVEG